MSNQLTNKEYWEKCYEDYVIPLGVGSGPVEQWIIDLIKELNLSNKSIFEIGCYPGSYLKVFGKYDCLIGGIDIIDKTKDLAKKLKKEYRVGTIIQGDIQEIVRHNGYDVVCSFGFIEHFINWEEILDYHINLANNNGYVMVTVPNFVGIFQRIFHQLVDGDNLKAHNLKAMNLNHICSALESRGMRVIKKGPIGAFSLWHNNIHPTKIQQKTIKFFYDNLKILERWGEHLSVSPYLGVVAQKVDNAKTKIQ